MAQKGNKVFYGEYTLEHWLNLIIKGNITLPPYQRYFVWNEGKTKQLIESIKAEEFVPPVTIGVYRDGEKTYNYIIDGQQRLTSILLAAIGFYPDVNKYKNAIKKLANENDDNQLLDNDSENDTFENMIDWKMNLLLDGNKSLQDIEKSIEKDMKYYKRIDKMLSNDDLKKYYLGFSYLVPDTNEKDNYQRKYYATVFRNINIQGERLSVQESREALYYLNDGYKDYFHPTFLDNYTVNELRIDFVRYLAFISQYNKDNSVKKLAYGFGRNLETYYEEYIYSIVNEKENSIFSSIKDFAGDRGYRDHLIILKKNIEKLELAYNYSSIIDLDMYFFGLIYYTMFQKKEINFNHKNEIKDRIENEIKILKSNGAHKKTPSALRYIRERLDDSIMIYGDYLDEQA